MSDPNQNQRLAGFDDLYNGFLDRYDEAPSSVRRRDFIVAAVLTVVLATIASLPIQVVLGEWAQVVQVIVGFPAGVLLFGLVVGLFEYTRLQDIPFMDWKQEHSFRQRIRTIAIVGVIIAVLLIVAQGKLPYGLGGTLVVALVLLGYNLGRRTPEELELARAGVSDPRDIKDETVQERRRK